LFSNNLAIWVAVENPTLSKDKDAITRGSVIFLSGLFRELRRISSDLPFLNSPLSISFCSLNLELSNTSCID
jgi:hypothetical protein